MGTGPVDARIFRKTNGDYSMALTKSEKQAVIEEVSELLKNSKMTVVAKYEGTTVKALQGLRRDARDNGTKVKVIKNRLVIQAVKATDNVKDLDTSALEGMLLYAFNGEDEVAPAQSLQAFAKQHPSLQFVGAITAEGKFLDADEVKALAGLPGKNQMIAGIVNTLNSPLQGVMSGLSGDLHGLLKALEAKAPAAAEAPATPAVEEKPAEASESTEAEKSEQAVETESAADASAEAEVESPQEETKE
jgi:large subunit ribosomal protein L10